MIDYINRRTTLRTCCAGLALSTATVRTSAAQTTEETRCHGNRNRDKECSNCGVTVLSETTEEKVVETTVDDVSYRYRIDKKSGSVHLLGNTTKSGVSVSAQGPIDTDLEIIRDSTSWGQTIRRYDLLGVDKHEVGIAATASEDIGNETGGAIGAVRCSLLPGAGWAAAGICGAVGSMVINIDTAGEEFTVGLWDERAGGFSAYSYR